MQRLLDDPLYRRHLDARGSRQCVLVGYSDSNKDGGLCAARMAIYRSQRALAEVLAQANERHVIFHGRGGSIPRGGGRIDALIRSAPPETINGVLRLTEQGEVVNQNYGLRPIAMRTLERAFNALLSATVSTRRGAPQDVQARYLEAGSAMAASSLVAYRRLVRGESAFYEYFRAVTPIDVIERMQIGSRPASRTDALGMDALRAVPWVFAWTQSRHMIPGWYGAGAGLAAWIERYGLDMAKEAHVEWHFFRNLVDDIETMLARTDLDIAARYDELAEASGRACAEMIRSEYSVCKDIVLTIKGNATLLDGDLTLQRALQLRNPYVDPMNLMQADLLRRWRATDRKDRDLFDALLASISGIAQGLLSTG